MTTRTGEIKGLPQTSSKQRWFKSLLNRLSRRLWYVYPDTPLIVNATPAMCLHILSKTSKPSMKRLHLDRLYRGGRRYHFVQGDVSGFRMETTSKVMWKYRGRTNPVTVLNGHFRPLDDDTTQINMNASLRAFGISRLFLLPLLITPCFMGAPAPNALRLLFLVLLYGLAWVHHRYSAMLEAHDMIFFVEKSLEDFVPTTVAELNCHIPYVVDPYQEDFAEAWEHFYQSHRTEIGT